MPHESIESRRLEHRPSVVRILFVGESPPANQTFFYLGNSALARYTREAFETAYSEFEDMSQFLTAFRELGCYLEDLCHNPVNNLANRQRQKARIGGIEELSVKIRELRPHTIFIVMKAIERFVAKATVDAGLPVIPRHVLPFPAQGHQRQYVAELTELLLRFDKGAND